MHPAALAQTPAGPEGPVIDQAVCITLYNESPQALQLTLASLLVSLRQARVQGRRPHGDTAVALLIDGADRADPALLQSLWTCGLLPQATGNLSADCCVRSRRWLQPLQQPVWAQAEADDAQAEEVELVVVLKAHNRGKLHSHGLFLDTLCPIWQPRHCFQMDVGSVIHPASIGAFLDRFAQDPRVGGLAATVRTAVPDRSDGLLADWQHQDFAMQAALSWPAELASGHLSVLPGQCSALRWSALRGSRTPADSAATVASPLQRYLRGLQASSAWDHVMFLAEDRVIGNEIVLASPHWTLGLCPDAVVTTDACTRANELLRQRRRWNISSTTCKLWLLAQWPGYLRRQDRDWRAKARLSSALVWQFLLVTQPLLMPAAALVTLASLLQAVQQQPHGGLIAAALALLVAAGYGPGLWHRARSSTRLARTVQRGRRLANAGLLLTLLVFLWTNPPLHSFAALVVPLVASVCLTSVRVAPRRGRALFDAAEHLVIHNPWVQVWLWAYAAWNVCDTSWGTKGLTAGDRAAGPCTRTALLGGWLGLNGLVAWWALSTPPWWLHGLNRLFELMCALLVLTVALAVLQRGQRWLQGHPQNRSRALIPTRTAWSEPQ